MLKCASLVFFFFFKQKTAYEMRISDWSSDVCSSDLAARKRSGRRRTRKSAAGLRKSAWQRKRLRGRNPALSLRRFPSRQRLPNPKRLPHLPPGLQKKRLLRKRSEEHTSELQSLMRNSYAVFC